MKVLLSRLMTILIPFQLVVQPVVTYAQVPSPILDTSERPDRPLNFKEVNQAVKQWFSGNRTTSEKAYPFRNPYLFRTFDEVERLLETESFNSRYDYRVLPDQNVASVYLRSNPNQVQFEFQLATRQELTLYSPKNMKKRIQEMAETAKRTGAVGAAGFKQAFLNLPLEAAIFYMAMGAVTAINLTANYGANPAGGKITHGEQTSALGITSLGLFLSTQAGASAVLSTVLKNPNWHVALPYLAMTFAMSAQNYAIGIATDPNIRACLKEWQGEKPTGNGHAEDPCEKAYEWMTAQKPWEFAPALTSMLISTAIQSAGQIAVSAGVVGLEAKLAQKAIGQTAKGALLRSGMLRFAVFVNPVGVPGLVITGASLYLMRTSHLVGFVLLDEHALHPAVFAMKNAAENVSIPFIKTLKKSSERLAQKIVEEKAHAWAIRPTKENCQVNRHGDCWGLYEDLNRFGDQMKAWRRLNLEKVLTTHASWQSYLNGVLGRYKAAESFYGRMIGWSRELIYGQQDSVKLINRPFPFLGSKTSAMEHFDESHISHPHLSESEQLEFVQKFQAEMLSMIAEYDKKRTHLVGRNADLVEDLKKYFKDNSGDSKEDQIKLGQGLIAVRKYLEAQVNSGDIRGPMFLKVRSAFVELGSPTPTLIPGQGVIWALKHSKALQDLYSPLEVPASSTLVKYKTMSDYFLTMMLCGPDVEKNEKMIKNVHGFYAEFIPPAITPAKKDLDKYNFICNGMGTGSPDLFYTTKLTGPYLWSSKQKTATYAGPFDYLKFNIKQSVMGDRSAPEDHFTKWWKEKTEAQMTEAFQDYQQKYNWNIAQLIQKLNRKENATSNFTDTVANGVFRNILQELRLNLLILGEMLKDSYVRQNNKVLPARFIEREKPFPLISADEKEETYPNIVKIFARGSFLDFNSIAAQYPKLPFRITENQTPYRLKIQTEIENKFEEMMKKISILQAQEQNGKIIITGELENSELEKLSKEIEALTIKFSDYLGIKGDDDQFQQAAVDQDLEEKLFNYLTPEQARFKRNFMGYLKRQEQADPNFKALALVNRSESANQVAINRQFQKYLASHSSSANENRDSNLVVITPGASKIAAKCLENIQGLGYEVLSYGLIINAVSWKNLQRIKEASEAEKQARQRVGQLMDSAGPAMKMGR